MTVYGIDLGTTYSCIARVDDTGQPKIIRNSIGEESTPSVVFFESPHNVEVGRVARNAALTDPQLVVSLIKRDIGKPGMTLDFHGSEHTPESISALILRDLVKSVEGSTGDRVADVVITVPAYFGVAEREATRQAGVIANLNVVNVVPEPVAAALYYGVLNAGTDRTILVFDLGGGTFDTTVIKLSGGDVTVVCTDGDHGLGGADWDGKLADLLGERFTEQYPDSDATDSEDFLQEVGLLAEDLKKALSGRRSMRQTIHFKGLKVTTEVTRAEFEDITAELLDRTMDITERTLALAADRGVTHYDQVLLVGGSTRMPAVAEALRTRFGFDPKVHEPDLAVAKGAALFALVESLRVRLTDDSEVDLVARELDVSAEAVRSMAGRKVGIVTPRAFGVAVLDPDDPDKAKRLVSHLLVANTPLPAVVTKQYLTSFPNQQAIDIEIWEQAGAIASESLEHNNQIGGARIDRLPPLEEGSPVDVTFRMDESGMLNVLAKEIRTGKEATTDITIGDLSEQQISAAQAMVARLS
ncbi:MULTISPECIES: Hsp70 family protein [Saccharothrix]|uniref:Hsp70 family protein n=1 Tax=Saccharothrix TaxID=2071 RepID=UPI00093B7C5C|nr:Hsp70 family protein [Saccharothrix sp. CB00851]OKI26359.1 molecular chaperone Hsp70 [Saccharothrix sp. CB00851]